CRTALVMDAEREKVLDGTPPRVRQGSFVSQQRWVTESLTTFSLQVLLPFLICGFGNIGAGQLLEYFQHKEVFVKISELIILVPSLMGLKGNLEMTLASRLSTAANCGVIDNCKEVWLITKGNLALLQCQATIVGLLAAMFAIAAGSFDAKPSLDNVFVIIASSLLTSNVASVFLSNTHSCLKIMLLNNFCLGLFLIAVVLICRSIHVNPDNVATPIASSLGDVITVALLAFTSQFTYTVIKHCWWWTPVVYTSLLVLITPLTVYYSFKNKYTKRVVCYGWIPIILAMIISSFAGIMLNKAMKLFENIAAYQPVINGEYLIFINQQHFH
ncbi:solute carrier family 41 member 1-like protein, partial [Leptotrombidium deliense]